MIELTSWTLVLLILGGVVAGLFIFGGCLSLYSAITGVPINFHLGPLTIRVNEDSE